MKSQKLQYEFLSSPWKYAGVNGWHFVSLPKRLSKEIRAALKAEEQGWGRLKVIAAIGHSEWNTAIWFDTKLNTYLLPLKAEIRKKERVEDGKEVRINLWI